MKKSSSREEEFILTHSLRKNTIQHGQEGMTVENGNPFHAVPIVRSQGRWWEREERERESWYTAHLLLLTQSGTPANWMLQPTFRTGLPSLVELLWKVLIDMPNSVFLVESEFWRADKEDWLSQQWLYSSL